MKKLPIFLASLFVILSIYRVGTFIQDVLNGLWLSWVFAIALAASVFCAGYYFKYSETRISAIVALVIFLPSDLMLNLLEVIRVTSAASLVANGANFMNVPAADLRFWMQAGGILFGVLQTLAAAVLGWMSAGTDRLTFGKAKAFLPRLANKVLGIFDTFFPAQAGGITQYASEANGKKHTVISGKSYARPDLTYAEKTAIAGMETRQIAARFGVSDRTARGWKQDARDGKL